LRLLLPFVLAAAWVVPSSQSPALAAGRQVPLDLSGVVNFVMPTATVPVGMVNWAGNQFKLDSRVYHTRNAALGWYPEELTLTVPNEGRRAVQVELLLNLDGVPADLTGEKVGEVVLVWGNGTQQTVDLIAGTNVRSWLVAEGNGALTDAGTRELYHSSDTYGRPAVIDSLTVVADATAAPSGLTKVIVRDTSFETAGSLDPALVLRAATVEAE